MPTQINGETYYRTAEVCEMVGICRNTLFSLAEKSVFKEKERRDARGWRLFTRDDVDSLKAHLNRVVFVKKGNTPV